MTAKKEMTLVYYYVPEDQDDPDFPNVFGVMMPKANVRYQHIEQNFPLKGQYIFRFKVMHDNNVVWLDLQDSQSRLPTFKDRIFVKATRVTWDNPELMKSPYRQEVLEQQAQQQEKLPQQPPRPFHNVELLSEPPSQPQPKPPTSSFMNIDSDLLI